MHRWRRGLSRGFAERARALRVAWALEWLFTDDGYAYPSDPHLASDTGLPLNKVQAALNDLEQGRAILRVHIVIDGKLKRRIFPAVGVRPPSEAAYSVSGFVNGSNETPASWSSCQIK